jgi:hypothetical protein
VVLDVGQTRVDGAHLSTAASEARRLVGLHAEGIVDVDEAEAVRQPDEGCGLEEMQVVCRVEGNPVATA